jgi:hypothetical protein
MEFKGKKFLKCTQPAQTQVLEEKDVTNKI